MTKRNGRLAGLVGWALVGMAFGGLAVAQAAKPIGLDQCIRTALADNPDMEAARARIEAAEAAFKKSEAAYYPWVFTQAGYMRTDNPPQAFMMSLQQRSLNMADPAFDPNEPEDTDNVRLTAGVKYTLYDSGRRALDRAMAGRGVEAASAGRRLAQNELIYQVTRGYYGVLQAQAFVGVHQEAVGSIEESLRVARERFDAGSAVRSDVLNLEVKLAQSNEDLIRARNGVQLALAALNTVIGEDLVEEGSFEKPEAGAALPATAAVDDREIENRPELEMADAMARLMAQKVERANREYRPSVSAFGTMDWDSPDTSDFERSYLVGVQAQWDLFTGFLRDHAVREARAERVGAEASVRRARQALRLDLKQAVLQESEARARVEVTRKSVESAREALRITQERYRLGAADLAEVLTSQAGLTSLQTRSVAAYYDFMTARYNLERARGALVKKYAEPAK